jgi:hypothetical protein
MRLITWARISAASLAATAGMVCTAPAAHATEPLSRATAYSVSSTESTAPATPSDADSGVSLLKKGSFDITEF